MKKALKMFGLEFRRKFDYPDNYSVSHYLELIFIKVNPEQDWHTIWFYFRPKFEKKWILT